VETAQHRQLVTYDFYFPEAEICDNGVDGVVDLGPCDTSKFPVCSDKEAICYNRKPSREHFYEDHHPKFYIQYNRVLCYPENFGGCSSCTPGRFCLSENRCIMADLTYNCADWY
jgi:hypothetical protein